jgi:hypothetical protein
MENAKQVGDYVAGGITVAALVGYLPQMAAAATLLYAVLRIWEGRTVQRLLRAVCARCADWWGFNK